MSKFIFFTLLFASTSAFAGLEIRVNSSSLKGNMDSLNNAMENNVKNTPDFEPKAAANGFDVRFAFPLIPLVVGYRTEKWNSSGSGSGIYQNSAVEVATKFEGERNTALLGYRFLSNPLFTVGILGHMGLGGKLSAKRDVTYGPTTRTSNFNSKMNAGYGVGVDGAFYLWKFLVSAEAGYTSFKGTDWTDDGEYLNISMDGVTVDYSGMYTTMSVGFAF